MSTRDSLEKNHQRAIKLLAKQDDLQAEYAALSKNVQFAMDKLLYKPEIDAVMETLQMRIHQKSVGKFEKLLTGIVNDVFPGIGKVVIDIENKRQSASLSISIMNGEFPEDPYSGRGGSIANVLSLGLRFIALTGGGFRKFIVLDEPDCWLKPERIPAFVNVISSLSREMGIQVLMVSHHHEAYFEKHAALVNLKVDKTELRAGKKIKSLCLGDLSGQSFQWEDEQTGIRSLHLKNFMSYKDLSIPLSPGFTVLTGDNDIGKSGAVVALRALIRDEWKDSFIRHTEQAALVELDLGQEGILLSARSKSGSKKTFHAHLNDTYGSPAGPSAPKWLLELGFSNDRYALRQDEAKTPSWVEKLGFDVNPMDVQIGLQKQPVFLLDKPGTQQAAVLSMGVSHQFYHVLSAVQSVYKAEFKQLVDLKKDGEKRLETLKRHLAILAPISAIEQEAAQDKKSYEELIAQQGDIKRLYQAMKQLEALSTITNLKPISLTKESALPFHDIAGLEASMTRLSRLKPFLEAKPVAIEDQPIPFQAIDPLIATINTLMLGEKCKAVTPIAIEKEAPAFQNIEQLTTIIATLSKGEHFKDLKPIELDKTTFIVHDPGPIFAVGKPLNALKKFKHLKPIEINRSYQGLVETPVAVLSTLTQCSKELAALNAQLDDINRDTQQIELNVKAYQEQLGDVCLACGQGIEHEHPIKDEAVSHDFHM